MPEGTDHAFAVGNDEQYRPVQTVGDQRVRVSWGDGTGLLVCHASRPLEDPRRDDGPMVVVVHGALRDSDRYLAGAQHAARVAESDALIVAPQFLADVDARAAPGVPDDALHWDVEGWKGGYPALGPAALSSFGALDSLLHQLAPTARPRPDQPRGRDRQLGGRPVREPLRRRGPRARRPGPAGAIRHLQPSTYVAIVLGTLDTDGASPLLEVSPAAMAQGANRFDRGLRYDQHVRRLARAAGLPARHRLIQLAGVGHTAGDVLAAPQTRELLFG